MPRGGGLRRGGANFEAALDIDPLDKRARQAKAALDAVHQERDKQSSSLLERLLGK